MTQKKVTEKKNQKEAFKEWFTVVEAELDSIDKNLLELNKLGYLEGATEETDDIELSGEIDLDNSNTKTVIEFDDERAEIDTRKDQKFTEV